MDYKTTAFDLKLALLQYFRFKRQWVCVDEFRGADIIVDTGKEIIEAEVKLTKSDLINGEKVKRWKHEQYKMASHYSRGRMPNKFLFCVPEKLVDVALAWGSKLNEKYGVIGFDVEDFERRLLSGAWHSCYLRIAKSAKSLHSDYKDTLRWAIARRTSAKIATLTEKQFRRNIRCKVKEQPNGQ